MAQVLERIRGTKNVLAEYQDMQDAVELSKLGNWRKLFTRLYRPQLVATLVIPFFQQFTGINAIMFYGARSFASSSLWGSLQGAPTISSTGASNISVTVWWPLLSGSGWFPVALTANQTLRVFGYSRWLRMLDHSVTFPNLISQGSFSLTFA